MSKKMIIVSISILLLMSGCGYFHQVVLHPIDREDFFEIKTGTTIVDKSGREIKTQEDGCFLSNYYIREVLKADIEKK